MRAVGSGLVDGNGNRVPIDVAEGDVVVYARYGGTEGKHDGQDHVILSVRDVLVKIGKVTVGVASRQAADRFSMVRSSRTDCLVSFWYSILLRTGT